MTGQMKTTIQKWSWLIILIVGLMGSACAFVLKDRKSVEHKLDNHESRIVRIENDNSNIKLQLDRIENNQDKIYTLILEIKNRN